MSATSLKHTKQPSRQTYDATELETILNRVSEALGKEDLRSAASSIERACRLAPQSTELLSSAASIFLRAGNPFKAIEYFEKVLALNPQSRDALHNLALIYWIQGRVNEARTKLHSIVSIFPDDADGYNDLALLEDQKGNTKEAEAAYASATNSSSATQKIFANYFEFCQRHELIDLIRDGLSKYASRWGRDAFSALWQEKIGIAPTEDPTSKRQFAASDSTRVSGLKIAFFASSHSFLAPIMDELRPRNQVRLFERGSDMELQSLLEWCDLAWFEWCDHLLIAATGLPKKCKIICRLHSYEVFTDMPRKVDWTKVDHLILVNESVKELLDRNIKVQTPTTIIHNGVDANKFEIPRAKKYGKRICSIGYINYKKNPALLLYCFKAIHDYDNQYRFHIAGAHQDPRIQVYFEHLLPKLNIPLSFDGWVEDISGYLKDKDYVISTSLFESFHYSIAEGMASGVIPLIHDWMGADKIYPDEFLFTTPDSCLQLLKSLEQRDRTKLGRECREFIVSRYDVRNQLKKTDEVIQAAMNGQRV